MTPFDHGVFDADSDVDLAEIMNEPCLSTTVRGLFDIMMDRKNVVPLITYFVCTGFSGE